MNVSSWLLSHPPIEDWYWNTTLIIQCLNLDPYQAVQRKRNGSMTAMDILTGARRLLRVCDTFYGGITVQMFQGRVPGCCDESLLCLIKIDELSVEDFEDLFVQSQAVVLSIKPRSPRSDVIHSFARMEWSAMRPATILYYAQQGGVPALGNKSITDMLLRRLFYVPNALPDNQFAIELGSDVALNEAKRMWVQSQTGHSPSRQQHP